MDLLAHFAAHLLEACFFLGLLGAVGVVLTSVVDDARELFRGNDEPA